MGTLHFLNEKRPPVEYTVRVRHHWNGTVEITVEDVGDSPEDRKKIASSLLNAAAFVEDLSIETRRITPDGESG